MAREYTWAMAGAKITTMRFTEADQALLATLTEHTGISNQTDVIRLALRALAEREGLRLAPIIRSAKPPALPSHSPKKKGPASTPIDRGPWIPLLKQRSHGQYYHALAHRRSLAFPRPWRTPGARREGPKSRRWRRATTRRSARHLTTCARRAPGAGARDGGRLLPGEPPLAKPIEPPSRESALQELIDEPRAGEGKDNGQGLGALGLLGLLPAEPLSLEAMKAEVRAVWRSLLLFGEQHSSDRQRLAMNLLEAAHLLLDEPQTPRKNTAGTAPKSLTDGRKRLANGAKAYVEARGGAWFTLKRSPGIDIARDDIEAMIALSISRQAELFPGLPCSHELSAAVVAGLTIEAWEHERWSWLIDLLREKNQPTTPPNVHLLNAKVKSLLKGKPETWAGQAGSILTAALRLAGVDNICADSLVLKKHRGKRKKSTLSGARRAKSTSS
jgi:hypothetical protein